MPQSKRSLSPYLKSDEDKDVVFKRQRLTKIDFMSQCPSAIIEANICPFLDVHDHHQLAKVSKHCLEASGFLTIDGQPVPKPLAWTNKHLCVAKDTSLETWIRITQVAKVKYLDLKAVPTDEWIPFLMTLPLTSLSLSVCELQQGLQWITQRGAFQSLHLHDCYRLTDSVLQYLGHLKLTSFSLTNGLTLAVDGLRGLSSHPLTSLNLTGSQVSDNDLSHLGGLPLTDLNLSCCLTLTDTGLQHLIRLSLATLNLNWCSLLSDNGLRHLANMPLTKLSLSHCTNITNGGLQHLTLMPLTTLSLSGCYCITDEGLQTLTNLPLTNLDVSGCLRLLDISLSRFRLKSLDISKCFLTDAGLQSLSQSSPALTSLSVSHCQGITDAGLSTLAQLPLTLLHLSSCPTVTDVGIRALSAMPLTDLSVSACGQLTNQALFYLAALPLIKLNISCCHKVTQNGIAYLYDLPLKTIKLGQAWVSLKRLNLRRLNAIINTRQ